MNEPRSATQLSTLRSNKQVWSPSQRRRINHDVRILSITFPWMRSSSKNDDIYNQSEIDLKFYKPIYKVAIKNLPLIRNFLQIIFNYYTQDYNNNWHSYIK